MSHRNRMDQRSTWQRVPTWLGISASVALMACSDSTGTDSEPLDPGGQSTGVIEVSITSTGLGIDFDTDGFNLSIDGAGEKAVANTGRSTTPGLTPGNHTLRLTGIAPNCSVEGGPQQTVRVLAGRKTFASFSVSCVTNIGNVRLRVTTIGPIPENTRYGAFLPGIGAIELTTNVDRSFEKVRAGSAAVSLNGVPANCVVDGVNPVVLAILFNATTDLAFTVRCVTPGALRLSALISGDDLPPRNYAIDFTRLGTSTRTYVNFVTDTTLAPMLPGVYSLNVLTIAPNCRLLIPNPRTVTIAAGDPAEVRIEIVCARVSLLAFVLGTNTGPDIYASNELGASLYRVVSGGTHPAWSPNGKRIAFVDERDQNRTHVMNADGSQNTRLTSQFGINPTWSPDGSRIAFEGLAGDLRGGRRQIFLVNADGSDEKQLFNTTTSEFDPDWSPDGLQLVLTRTGGGLDGLWVMNVDGTGGRRLTARGNDRDAAWSPDGKTIAFTRTEGQSTEIYLIDLHDNLTKLTRASMSASGPTWSPDGGKVAYSAYTRICPADFYYAAAPCDLGLFFSTLDGIAARINTPVEAVQPAWRR